MTASYVKKCRDNTYFFKLLSQVENSASLQKTVCSNILPTPPKSRKQLQGTLFIRRAVFFARL